MAITHPKIFTYSGGIYCLAHFLYFFMHITALNIPDTVLDVSTDSAQGWKYLDGSQYTKYVNSVDHESLTIQGSNCTTTIQSDQFGMYTAQCLERDPLWGILTLVIMFLPGLQLYSLFKCTNFFGPGVKGRIILVLVAMLFPISNICLKVENK